MKNNTPNDKLSSFEHEQDKARRKRNRLAVFVAAGAMVIGGLYASQSMGLTNRNDVHAAAFEKTGQAALVLSNGSVLSAEKFSQQDIEKTIASVMAEANEQYRAIKHQQSMHGKALSLGISPKEAGAMYQDDVVVPEFKLRALRDDLKKMAAFSQDMEYLREDGVEIPSNNVKDAFDVLDYYFEYMNRLSSDWSIDEEGLDDFIVKYEEMNDGLGVIERVSATNFSRASLDNDSNWMTLKDYVENKPDGNSSFWNFGG